MAQSDSSSKHIITWDQFVAFAKAQGRDVTHALRVFKGERKSDALAAEFEAHFGFPMAETSFAGRRRTFAA